MRDDIVLLVGRLLLAWIFLHEGVFLLVNYSASSAAMGKMGAPSFAMGPVIALQCVAGLSVAAGWYTRCGALALGLFCLATAMLFHSNFLVRNELLHFEKDLAIAGGLFALMVCGAGRWSIDGWRRALVPAREPAPHARGRFARGKGRNSAGNA